MNHNIIIELFHQIDELATNYSFNIPKDYSEIENDNIILAHAIMLGDKSVFWSLQENKKNDFILIALGYSYTKNNLQDTLVLNEVKLLALDEDILYFSTANSINIHWEIPVNNFIFDSVLHKQFTKRVSIFFELMKTLNVFKINSKEIKSIKRKPSPICLKKKQLRRRK